MLSVILYDAHLVF